MLQIEKVGAVLVDLRNKALASEAKGHFYLEGFFTDVKETKRIATKCIEKLAAGDIKGFCKYLQSQSAEYSDTFDFIVQELFDKLEVVGTCPVREGSTEMCVVWEDFVEQFLTA
jgi:hypothetical protein